MNGRIAYSLCMLLAIAVFFLGRRLLSVNDPARKLPLADRFWIGLSAFFGGAVAAKLPNVLMGEPGLFSLEAWATDGKTITAGLMGAYLGVEICKALRGITVKTGDGLAVPLALALTVGRFGCFLNGCCAGQPSDLPWSVDFGDCVRRHPTQLYEVLFHATWVVLLARWQLREAFPTNRLKIYLIAYCVFRFLMEFIRTEPRLPSGLTIYQWLVAIFAAGLAMQWIVQRKSSR